MSFKYPGGLITKTPVTPSASYETSAASGIWKLSEVDYWISQGLWPTAGNIATDPYFYDVTMLLTGNGTNGAQNNTFLDSSSNAFSITRNGNTTQGSFSPYGSLWGNYFNGSSSYLSWTGINTNTGTFTLEAWIYPTANGSGSYGGKGIICCGDVVLNMGFDSSNKISARWYTGSSGQILTSTTAVSLNTWTHVAVTWQSGTAVKIYINGVLDASTTSNVSIGSATSWYIGREGAQANYFSGYISNARICTSIIYTSNFTPSTTPLTAVSGTNLLTCQSNRFIDNSSNAYAITVNGSPSVQRFSPFNPTASYSTATIGGSGYFDGSGDYLTGPTGSTNLDLSSGAWTIECWVYMNTTSTGQGGLISVMSSGLVGWAIDIGVEVSGAVSFFNYNGSNPIAPSIGYPQGYPYTIKPYCWNHIAVSSNGSTVKLFINGVLQAATGSGTPNFNSSCQLSIGQWSYGSGIRRLNGYLNDVRIVKGTQVYTSTFTPPTSPLTAISGTQYLGNMTNAGIPDYAMMNDLETVGNAQVSTSVKKFGTGSIAFDGTADAVLAPSSPQFNFGTGDFTIEGWHYLTGSTNVTKYIFDTRLASGTASPALYITSNTYQMYISPYTTGGTVVADTWVHWAWVKTGGYSKLYINGTSVVSMADTNNYSQGCFRLGSEWSSSGSYDWVGYMDDVRVTKGYARYTANFTPPTSAFYTY